MTFTFDTGMLIGLERRKRGPWEAFRAVVRRGFVPVVPAVVCAEWWRGRSDIREDILSAVIVEGMPPALCRAAGEALAAVRGSSLADFKFRRSCGAFAASSGDYYTAKCSERSSPEAWPGIEQQISASPARTRNDGPDG